MLQTIFSSIFIVFEPLMFLYLCLGFFIGVIFGALPGLTSLLAIVLLLPMTYTMPITAALIMCMGIYMAGIYSGCITAITINIPGAPSAIMTSIDGHAMMKEGKGAKAIGYATIGSMIGGTIGALLLIFISPLTMELALHIKTPGKFSLILFAFIVICLIENKNRSKAVISLCLGAMVSTVGIDVIKPIARFTFGISHLLEGIDITTLIIGAFALSEIFNQASVSNAEYNKYIEQSNKISFKRKEFFPSWAELREIGIMNYLKSSLIGYFIGVLPGAGASMAAFVSYIEAKRSSKHPEQFGQGSPEGIVASETANNAVCGGALVPMLALGIPGDGTTAVILGVLLVYGIVPGPTLLGDQLSVIAPMYMALLVSASVLLPVSLYLFGPYYLKITQIPRITLYSTIAVVAILGVYAATTSIFQMGIAVLVGIVMFLLSKQGYPSVPFILAVILGPLFEEYLRTSLTLSNGNPMIFITNYDSLIFLILTIIFSAVFLKPKKIEE